MARHVLSNGAPLYTRNEWRAREPGDMTRNGTLVEVFLHHTTTPRAETVDRFTEQVAAMRATQDFHMDVRGWSDIGYAFIVFQPYGNLEHARVFQGRETKWVPAGQEGHNTGTVPISVYGNFQGDDRVKGETIDTIVALIRWIERHHDGSLRRIGGHRDVVETTCPGDTLYRQIPTIARRSGLQVLR